MSKDLNKCTFIGRIGQEIDLRYLPNGTACANFSLAVGDDYKTKDGEKVEQTEWVKISAFGKPAEVLGQYCTKGSKLYVEGKLKTRSWEKDGVKQYMTEISLADFQMLDSKPADGQQRPSAQRPAPQHRATPGPVLDIADDDIPF